MTASPLEIAREFERMNAGNGAVDLCKTFGREMADAWIIRLPPPWSEDDVDCFSAELTESLGSVLMAQFPSRADRRRSKDAVTMLQGVALVAALDRIKQHALSGFGEGSA